MKFYFLLLVFLLSSRSIYPQIDKMEGKISAGLRSTSGLMLLGGSSGIGAGLVLKLNISERKFIELSSDLINTVTPKNATRNEWQNMFVFGQHFKISHVKFKMPLNPFVCGGLGIYQLGALAQNKYFDSYGYDKDLALLAGIGGIIKLSSAFDMICSIRQIFYIGDDVKLEKYKDYYLINEYTNYTGHTFVSVGVNFCLSNVF